VTKFSEYGSALSKGLIEGWAQYHRWSRELNVHACGVEPYLSTKVAEALQGSTTKHGWVALESRISNIQRWSCANAGGIPTNINLKGRVDVTYFNSGETLRGLVEVKRNFGFAVSRSDSDRLLAMLRRFGAAHGGTLRWAAVAAVHLSEPGKKPAEKRLEDARNKFANMRQQ
jgi:hypothetical protein